MARRVHIRQVINGTYHVDIIYVTHTDFFSEFTAQVCVEQVGELKTVFNALYVTTIQKRQFRTKVITRITSPA